MKIISYAFAMMSGFFFVTGIAVLQAKGAA